MKAKLVFGRLVRIEDDRIVLEVKKGTGKRKETKFPLAIELTEKWVAQNLGKPMNVVLIDGEVHGFRD